MLFVVPALNMKVERLLKLRKIETRVSDRTGCCGSCKGEGRPRLYVTGCLYFPPPLTRNRRFRWYRC